MTVAFIDGLGVEDDSPSELAPHSETNGIKRYTYEQEELAFVE